MPYREERQGERQRTRHVAHSAIERELTDRRESSCAAMTDLAASKQDPDRDREIK
jgi:hypothetical protein